MAFVDVMRKRDYNPVVSYEQVRPLMQWTYVWMVLGLVVTTVVAYLTVNTDMLLQLRASTGIVFGAIIVEFILVIALSWAMPRLSAGVAAIMFIVYAALNGFTLSVLLLVYAEAAVTTAFLATAGLFGALSVFAFTTQIDLTRWQNYLFVGLVGLLIAMVVNMFVGSGALEWLISIIGVLIFTALIAFDTQKLKRLAASPEFQENGSAVAKMSIFMALELYLDFVNLFIFLLRLFGSSRD
ncbi:MAG: Bax inhibitor-1/YccA family protein [Anaerolineae bacterium]|nr:Bax inhibitor-1/YccA family protein [Anaerolineae bacterium]NUQ02646.1 Bax inhibitor-1/YccA family protein [Anaerolineae bacterium]